MINTGLVYELYDSSAKYSLFIVIIFEILILIGNNTVKMRTTVGLRIL